MKKLIQIVEINNQVSERGALFYSDYFEPHDFQAKRIYFLKSIPPNKTRGNHAHKKLRQIFFCVQGQFQLSVSDGIITETQVVKDNSAGYLVEKGLWRQLSDFSTSAICAVLASDSYDPTDYIHDFDDFKKWKTL
jgi:dTDP-4-dehydrorhamnose 3,5-epimerase-like enzyme